MDEIKCRETYIVTDEQLQNKPEHILKHLKTRNCNQIVIKQAINCFNTEIEKLKKLDHSQCKVAQIIESFEEQQEFYIVSEYIIGQNLNTEIKTNNPWNEEQVIDLLQQVLEILKYIHQEDVKHFNIKPSNLVKRSDGKIFLIDFGGVNEISTLSFNNQTQIVSKQPVGTKGYMPPEQENGLPLYSNCDLYALGMTAIQALTGVSPDDINKNPQTNKIIWLNKSQVDKKLTQILDKMVDADFRERYQSADEVLKDLSQIRAMPRSRNIEKVLLILPNILFVIVIIFLVWDKDRENHNVISPRDPKQDQAILQSFPPTILQPSPITTIKPSQPALSNEELNNTDIRIAGSNSMAKIKTIIKNSFEKKYKNSRIVLVPGSSGEGINAVEKNDADIAASSRPLTTEEQNKNSLVSEPIAEDRLVFVTGINNPYEKGFSQNEIRKILVCNITNWSAFGGAKKTIRVIMKPLDSGTTTSVKDIVLNGENFCNQPNFKILAKDNDTQLLVPELGTDGIGYASSLNIANHQTVTVQRIDKYKWNDKNYPYIRKLFFVYKSPFSPKVEAFRKYLKSPEVQEEIKNITNVTEP
ncbi:serine/threonine-protein kinase [Nostoc sp.]|uniref:serine/threonine-protein kinase n=1 Tax=Nostoc sp. TaxID=1180 RepID=UPI002FF7ED95